MGVFLHYYKVLQSEEAVSNGIGTTSGADGIKHQQFTIAPAGLLYVVKYDIF